MNGGSAIEWCKEQPIPVEHVDRHSESTSKKMHAPFNTWGKGFLKKRERAREREREREDKGKREKSFAARESWWLDNFVAESVDGNT